MRKLILLSLFFSATVAISLSQISPMISLDSTSIPPSTPFIVTQALGSLRNNFTGCVGVEFRLTLGDITVTDIGRWVVSGNSGTHTVYIISGTGTVFGSASVNTSGAAVADYKYASVTPFSLLNNTTYYIVSSETNGSDQWYDLNTTYTSDSHTTAGQPTIWAGCAGVISFPASSAGHTYVPPNFKFHQ